MRKWVKGIVGAINADEGICKIPEEKEAPGRKLQTYLKRELGLTARQISGAKFREDGILVNGVRRRVSEMVYPGDVVEVLLEDAATGSGQLLPLQQELDILYEDEDILAVNKPTGMVVHPSHGHYRDTLANAVNYYFASRGECVRIRAIGRLDKETSGIVVFAKNQTAAARLAEQKERGLFQKKYTALVQGHPEPASGTITADIARDESTLMKMKVCERGMRAVTHYKTMKSNGRYSLVELSLETGRTHQIRVHMASIGHPLLGDRLYGEASAGKIEKDNPFSEAYPVEINRAALHAGFCSFSQPFGGERICIEAALPGDMAQYIKQFQESHGQ